MKQLLKDPSALEFHEELFGPLREMETDEWEAKKGWLRQQNRERHRLARIEAWLRDPDLVPWVEKIKDLRRRCPHRNPEVFELFADKDRKISKRLKTLKLRFAYVTYKKPSMLIHGSTMEHFFNIGNDWISPRFTADEKNVQEIAENLGRISNNALVCLFR